MLCCVLAVPQLHVDPHRAEVGAEVVVTVLSREQPAVGVVVHAEGVDGGTPAVVGRTDAAGQVRWRPTSAGHRVVRASIAGVDHAATVSVREPRRTWMLAFACVPLGLALLWWNLRTSSRARGRRAP
jgi:hypothetical protein